MSQREVTYLSYLETNEPPWSAVFDPDGRLWCVLPYPEEPVLVFEPRGDSTNLTVSAIEEVIYATTVYFPRFSEDHKKVFFSDQS